MTISTTALVADIAAASPATIKVFQRHHIEFCCGGKIPLEQACERQQLDVRSLIAELDAASQTEQSTDDWTTAPLADLVAYIQRRFHRPLEAELPRLGAMLDKVVSRHGDRLPGLLLPLRDTFVQLQSELLTHMAKEDAVLFPALIAVESSQGGDGGADWTWIEHPIAGMEEEHASAGEALARMSALTGGYTPPADACPTFRGLYHGLAELEREMHVHVHLENHVLFPRAAALAGRRSARQG